MEKRYSVLRMIGTIYKILGVLVGILTIVGALLFCAGGLLGNAALANASREAGGFAVAGPIAAVLSAVVSLIVGTIWAVTLFALGDFIYLLLSIEENTRATSLMLRSQPAPAPAAPPASQQPIR
jgi:hypothetical protein